MEKMPAILRQIYISFNITACDVHKCTPSLLIWPLTCVSLTVFLSFSLQDIGHVSLCQHSMPCLCNIFNQINNLIK